jgi:hypothetical protein
MAISFSTIVYIESTERNTIRVEFGEQTTGLECGDVWQEAENNCKNKTKSRPKYSFMRLIYCGCEEKYALRTLFSNLRLQISNLEQLLPQPSSPADPNRSPQ